VSQVDVLVIGGGVSGLSLLHSLEQQGLSAECWEADACLGGKIQSHRANGYLTEAAATMVLNFRPEVSLFLQQAKMAQARQFRSLQTDGQRYLLRDGALQAVPATIPALFRSSVFKPRSKLRCLREWMIPRGGGPGESVTDFITRRLGSRILEQAMEPFVAGTLAADADKADAYSVLPRLTTLERKYGSITAGVLAHKVLGRRTAHGNEVFSYAGGMGEFITRLANACRAPIRTGLRARKLRLQSGRWQVSGESATHTVQRSARSVALCCPAYVAARLIKETDSELSGWLSSIAYAPLSVVHLGFSAAAVGAPLDGTGFLVPRKENLCINGNLWPSSLFTGRAPPGKVLLSSYMGGARHPQFAALDDEKTLARVLADLVPPLGLRGDPEWVRIDRHPRALPLYHGNYFALSQAIKHRAARVGGLRLVANYLDGVSVRDRILQAQQAARDIALALHPSAAAHAYATPTRAAWSDT